MVNIKKYKLNIMVVAVITRRGNISARNSHTVIYRKMNKSPQINKLPHHIVRTIHQSSIEAHRDNNLEIQTHRHPAPLINPHVLYRSIR